MSGAKKAPIPKICHTYPTIMKLGTVISYLKKIQRYINHVTHSVSSADISIFHRKSAIFVISRNSYTLDFNISFIILLTLLETLKVVLTSMVGILMMPAKLYTLGVLKIMVF